MILGYSLIVVPVGIVSAETVRQGPITTQVCTACSREGHAYDAKYCKYCSEAL